MKNEIIPKDIQRFWNQVEISDNCWVWRAGKTAKNYGQFWLNGKHVKVHRFSYELLEGHIPDNLQIDHLCRTRLCVNPAHMQLVTCRENILRGNGVGAICAKKTHCPKGHEYNAENTYTNSQGWRYCRVCGRERKRND